MELLFPALKEGKNCKIFLVSRLAQDPPTVLGTNQTCSPAHLYDQLLPNMQYFPNHWSMQIYFTSGIGPDIFFIWAAWGFFISILSKNKGFESGFLLKILTQ